MIKYDIEKLETISLTDLAERLGIQRKTNQSNWECFDLSHQNQNTRPSLSINDEKGFNCFKCKMHGVDAIGLYKEFNHCSFQEALQGLSNLFNIPTNNNNTTLKSPKHADLLKEKTYLEYAKVFKEQKHISAQNAKQELENRKIDIKTAIKYQVAVIDNFFIPQIDVYNKENKSNYPTNYDVIAFPMYDAQSKYTGLKYRLFKNDFEKLPKDIGVSKSMTLSRSKSGLMYNGEDIENSEEVLICEGEIDGLSIASLGFKNIVINMGGVMSCMEMIKSVCKDKKIISFYDNDEAGQEANSKLSKVIKMPIFAVNLPLNEGKKNTDINDKILEGWGNVDVQKSIIKAEKIKGIIKGTEDFLDYLNRDNTIKTVYSTGILNNKFYQLIYCPAPYILFSDRTFSEVEMKDSSFDFEGEKFKLKQSPIPKRLHHTINSISKKGITNFIAKKQSFSRNEIFKNLLDILNRYYEFYDKNEGYVVAAHIIHSYLLGLFGKTVYLLLNGEKGTGKSSLQLLISKLQFNGNFAGKSSIPVTVRKIDSFQCALNLDEFEKIAQDDRKTMIGVLNTGYSQGATYEIVDTNKKNKSEQIQSFCTFATKSFSVNNLRIFDDSLLSRCFTISTVRNKKPVEDLYDQKREREKEFQEIRNNLFAYCMEHWEEINESCQSTKRLLNKRNIMGRAADSLAILGGVYLHFNNDPAFIDYLVEHEVFDEEENKNERAEIIFNYLEQKIEDKIKDQDTIETFKVTNKELVTEINTLLNLIEFDKHKATSHSVARILRSYRIIDSINAKRERITNGKDKGRVEYVIKFKHLVKILKDQGRLKKDGKFINEEKNTSLEKLPF